MSQGQRDALFELLRDAPLDLGGDVNEQRIIFEEMMGATPIPADVTTATETTDGIAVVNVDVAGADRVITEARESGRSGICDSMNWPEEMFDGP